MQQVETSPDGRYIRYDNLLGRGAYKAVYKAFDSHDAVEVAWNKLQVHKIPNAQLQSIQLEVDLLKRLDHKNIINLFASWTGTDSSGKPSLDFITELMTSGTLKEYLTRTRAMKLKVIRRWCHNLLEAITYLHEQNPPVMHRDLKCDNIFINGNVGELKIGDLGLSGIKRNAVAQSVLGTPEFMAPELYEQAYTEKVDVYAFGMCMLEMITMEYPYSECKNAAQIFRKVFSGQLPQSFQNMPPSEIKEVIGACLQKESKRPSARQLLEHPFFAEWASDDGKMSNSNLTNAKELPRPMPDEQQTRGRKAEKSESCGHAKRRPSTGRWLKRGKNEAEGSRHGTLGLSDNGSLFDTEGGYSFTRADVSIEKKEGKDDLCIKMQVPVDGELGKVEFFFNPANESVEAIVNEVVEEFNLKADEARVILRDLREEYEKYKLTHSILTPRGNAGSVLSNEKIPSSQNRSPLNRWSYQNRSSNESNQAARSGKHQHGKTVSKEEDDDSYSATTRGSSDWGSFDMKAFKINMALLEHCANGSLEVVQEKLRDGADVNYADYDGRTPLHLASIEGHDKVVSLLIDHGADVEAEDRWGSTPLDDATRNGHNNVVKALISGGADADTAVGQGEEAHSMELMQYSANGFYDMVREKLMAGARASFADYDKRTPLHLSCAEGHEDVTELLLINGADPMFKDRFGSTPTDEAVKNGHEDMVHLLRRYGGYVPAHLLSTEEAEYQYGMDLVHHASRGRLGKVEYLLENGANVQFADYDKRTALHLACAEGHVNVAMALVEAGADPRFQDRWGVTSLDEAERNSHSDLLNRLKNWKQKSDSTSPTSTQEA